MRILFVFAGLPAVLLAAPARADVLDISPDGVRTVYAVPSVFRTEGVRPILASQVTAHAERKAALPSPDIRKLLAEAAGRYAIRADLLTAVAWHESHFQPDAVSPKGAFGIMQLMGGTARDVGVDRYDLAQNILGGAAYLRQMMDRFGGVEALAVAAYNAGPQAVDRAGGIPSFPQTQAYVSAVLAPAYQKPSLVLVDR
jgi:soluble lytic murein transglycosylase-like protein